MSEEINGTVSTESTETVDTQNEKTVDVESNANDEKHERTFTRAEIGKMLAAERTKWETEQVAALEQAKSEGERLAKLSKDERAREEEAKRIADLEKREQDIAEREMADEGLPQEFLDHVLAPTAEEVKAKITALRDVFDSEVEKRVNERLVQSAPRRGTTTGITKEQIMAVEDDDQRQALIAENIQLFRKG